MVIRFFGVLVNWVIKLVKKGLGIMFYDFFNFGNNVCIMEGNFNS